MHLRTAQLSTSTAASVGKSTTSQHAVDQENHQPLSDQHNSCPPLHVRADTQLDMQPKQEQTNVIHCESKEISYSEDID